MRIVAYVGVALVVGLAAAMGFVWWAVAWWLAVLWWLVESVVVLTALAATSPTYWGEHGRKGPRARSAARRRPD